MLKNTNSAQISLFYVAITKYPRLGILFRTEMNPEAGVGGSGYNADSVPLWRGLQNGGWHYKVTWK